MALPPFPSMKISTNQYTSAKFPDGGVAAPPVLAQMERLVPVEAAAAPLNAVGFGEPLDTCTTISHITNDHRACELRWQVK